MAGNPFDQFDGPTSLSGLGGIRVGTPNPAKAAAEARAQAAADRAANADVRAAAAAERAARQEDKPPAGFQRSASGGLEFIPGGPADPASGTKAPTGEQQTAALFYGRAMRANGKYSTLPAEDTAPRSYLAQKRKDIAPGIDNMLISPGRQVSDNDAKDFIMSTLRKESGAAIGAQEYANQYDLYFPRPGDSAEVLTNKAEARAQAMEGLRIAAGPAAKDLKIIGDIPTPKATSDKPPIVGAVPPGVDKSTVYQAAPGGDGGPSQIATGDTRVEPDNKTSAALDRMIRDGRSSSYINAYLKGNGADPVSASSVAAAQAYLKTPAGKAFNGSMGSATRNVQQSTWDKMSTSPAASVISGIAGAGTAGFNDEIKGAIQTAIMGGSMTDNIAAANAEKQGLASLNPKANLAGNVAGGIGAQLGGAAVLAKFPALAAAVAKAPAVFGDAAFGGLYGTGENNDNRALGGLSGLAAGVGGGYLGRTAARGAGAVLSGVTAPVSRRLSALGVPLTGGQIMRERGGIAGKTIGGIEDAMTSVPGVGDLITARRNDGLEAMNRAAFDIAGRPIGHQGGEIGADGIAALEAAKADAYRQSLGGMNLSVDPQLGKDLAPAAVAGAALPDNLRAHFDAAMRKVAGFIDPTTGMIPGKAVQAIKQTLRAEKSASQGTPGGQFLVDALRPADDAFMGLAQRQSPAAFGDYLDADATHGLSKVLQKAVGSASGKSGDPGVFGGAQLATALKGGNVTGASRDALGQLSRDAVTVLPSQLGDSGTVKRAVIGAGSTGGLAGAGFFAPGAIGPGVGVGALAAVLNTKIGQKAVQAALIGDRGVASTAIGNQIKDNADIAGLFGRGAALPYLLQGQ